MTGLYTVLYTPEHDLPDCKTVNTVAQCHRCAGVFVLRDPMRVSDHYQYPHWVPLRWYHRAAQRGLRTTPHPKAPTVTTDCRVPKSAVLIRPGEYRGPRRTCTTFDPCDTHNPGASFGMCALGDDDCDGTYCSTPHPPLRDGLIIPGVLDG